MSEPVPRFSMTRAVHLAGHRRACAAGEDSQSTSGGPGPELRRSSWAYARELAERPREAAPSDPAPDSVRSQRARHRRCGERLCGPRFLLIAGHRLSCALPSKIFCGPSHALPNSIIWEGQNDKSRTNLLKILVGAAGFEPTTCSTQN